MSLPSKLTSYEASGKKILGAVVPGGNTAKVLDKLPDAQWVVAGNPAALAEVISILVNQGTSEAISEVANTTNTDTEGLRNQRIEWVLNLIKK